MKRYLYLFLIIPFLLSCGAGGGEGSNENGAGNGGDNTTGKTNPLCTSISKSAKIRIKEDGVYRITYTDIYNSCLDLYGVDINSLKMTNQGEEIAIDVIDNNSNDILDEGDYIDFYGMAISRSDDRFRYTETNVYWLSLEDGAHKRIVSLTSNPQTTEPPLSFLKTIHLEEDTQYVQGISTYLSLAEHWFWGDVFSTPGSACENLVLEQCKTHPEQRYYFERDYNFSTPHIDENQQVSLKIRLQAVSGSHHLRVYLNNPTSPVYDKTWSEQTPFEIEITVLSSYLNSIGTNTLTLESVGDTEFGIFDFFYLDWFEVSYYHTYQAEHDVLEFTGKDLIEVTDFSSENIHVYAISNHNSVQKVVPQEEIGWTLSTGYKVRFSGSQDTEGKFIAVADEKKKVPFSVEVYVPTDLRSKGPADYIIITHEDFYYAIIPLAEYRTGKGHNVLTVKIGDVYNEFSDGIETPQAIKDFLTYAYNNNWSTKYVLLVGDATLDYKDVSGYGKSNGVKSYVPAYFYNYSGSGEVPSDNWFADVDDANGILPEMSIGRIPAKFPEDVTAVISKIKAHETTSPASSEVLLIADDMRDEDGNLVPDDQQKYEILSEEIAGIVPVDSYSISRLYQSQREYYPDEAVYRKKILSELNSGPLILNYTGHGAVREWTKESVFSSEDIVLLQNQSYPFVVTLNCLNGYFVLPDDNVVLNNNKQYPSIAEVFLLSPEKGALAVFAASAIGYASEHGPLAEALYKEIFKEGETILGDAVTEAKKVTGISEDVVQTFIFFGDPATRLK